MSSKFCSKCQSDQPLSLFTKNKNSKDGLAHWCRTCCTAGQRLYQAKHRERLADYKHEWYAANRERLTQRMREHYRLSNKDEQREIRRAYYEAHRERFAESRREWKRKNRKSYNAYHLARRKRVKKATPPWADRRAIFQFYKNCPPGFHVDHIIPLNGKTVCGLHVLENLQYLPAEENIRKGNKLMGVA